MTPLVLIHGFMGGGAQWEGQVSAFAGKRDVIALDLPGFGANSHMEPIDRIEGFAHWVVDALNGQGLSRFHLLGHSMGGMIAQEIARLLPDRIEKLILYATGSVGVLPGRFETIAESKARAHKDGAAATARRISATWFLDWEEAPAYEGCAAIATRASAGAIQAGLDAMEKWSGADKLDRISAPTLVIWGDGDRTYPWSQIERLWAQVPSCNLAVVPECAHAVHLEKPELFNQIVDDFLS